VASKSLKEITVSDIIGSNENKEKQPIGTQYNVLNFVRQYPEGVSIGMVADYIGISNDRARDILHELVLKREIYQRKIPRSVNLFYPNGKLIHKYLQDSKDFNDQIFRISFHEGRKCPRIQIQERKFSLLEGEKVEGSIFIDYENIGALRVFIDEMLQKFESFQTEREI
jgi:hypothetical protein